jgi:hypothetical protein
MFETFCVQLAFGLALGLLLMPVRVVNPRFYRIQFLICLGLAVGAGAASWSNTKHTDLYWLGLSLAAATFLIGSWAWHWDSFLGGWAYLVVCVAAGVTPLLGLALNASDFMTTCGSLLAGAALLGLALSAMLLGHWYLIAPNLSIAPLLRLLKALLLSVGIRMLISVATLFGQPSSAFDVEAWLWLALHWGAGLIGAAVLAWMAWQSARIRSTQSATGILYVVVIFVFLGELSAQLLQAHLQSTRGIS